MRQANHAIEEQLRLFYDHSDPTASQSASARRSLSGGFYSTEEATLSDTILRLKSGMDKSQPSTNAVSASNLFRLGTSLSKTEYIRLGEETISAFESEILQYPWLFVSLLTGVVSARLGVKTIHVSSGEDEELRKYRTSPRAEATALILGGKPESSSPSAKIESENVAGGASQSSVGELADSFAKASVVEPSRDRQDAVVETAETADNGTDEASKAPTI